MSSGYAAALKVLSVHKRVGIDGIPLDCVLTSPVSLPKSSLFFPCIFICSTVSPKNLLVVLSCF